MSRRCEDCKGNPHECRYLPPTARRWPDGTWSDDGGNSVLTPPCDEPPSPPPPRASARGSTTVKVFTVGLLGALSAIAGGFVYTTTGEASSTALAVFLILATFYFGWTTAGLIRVLEK